MKKIVYVWPAAERLYSTAKELCLKIAAYYSKDVVVINADGAPCNQLKSEVKRQFRGVFYKVLADKRPLSIIIDNQVYTIMHVRSKRKVLKGNYPALQTTISDDESCFKG